MKLIMNLKINKSPKGVAKVFKEDSHQKSLICHRIGLRGTGKKFTKTGKASIGKGPFLSILMKILPKKWRKFSIYLK